MTIAGEFDGSCGNDVHRKQTTRLTRPADSTLS